MVDAIISAIEHNPLMQIIIAAGVVLWLIYRVDGVFKALIGWLRNRDKPAIKKADTQDSVKVILERIETRMNNIEKEIIIQQNHKE